MTPTNASGNSLDALLAAYATIPGDWTRMRQGIDELMRDHAKTPANVLEDRAQEMLPRCSRHEMPTYVVELLRRMTDADPFLAGALLRVTWTAGKVGFPMLPDPRRTASRTYRAQRDVLAGWLTAHTRHHTQGARRLLHGDDLRFFDGLPRTVDVYRGTAGMPADLAAAGLCWTTDPDLAHWFADRAAAFGGGAPVVVAARVQADSDVLTVFALEDEIVTVPSTFRTIATGS